MANSDLGHKLTDAELAKLERRIAKLYREAGKELQETIDAYFEQFKKRDEEMKALIGTVQNGKEWTEADYKQWRLNQIGRGERYQAMRDKVAHRVTDANAVAVSYTNDATPGIYSLNRNYSAYTIEQVAGNVGFDLWDEQTVKRLMVEQPDLMPYYPPKRALKRGIDLEYGKKQITKSVTSSILQGKSIKHMADDLQKRITTMSRDSAIRTARTAVTGAQNAGRMDSYAAAQKMGIKLKKRWLATLDNKTRHAHAMLDGQTVDIDKPFKVDGEEIMFPGDTSAPGYLVYSCRCTTTAVVDGADTSSAQRRARNADTSQTEVISNMTYAEWAGWKKKDIGTRTFINLSDVSSLKEYGKFSKEWEKETNGILAPLERETAKWKTDFPEAAKVANGYTNGKDWYLNTYARTVGNEKEFAKFSKKAGASNVEYAKKNGDILQNALESAHLGENVVTYRGINGLKPFENAIGKKYDLATGLFGKKVSPQEFVGAEITEKGFMSMTLDADRAGKFVSSDIGAIFEVRVPKEANAIYAEPISYYGRDAISREMEILAKKGSTLKIISIDTTQTRKNSFGEEVAAPWKIVAELIH